MSFSWCLQYYLLILFSSLNIVRTVPPEYCLSPLNRSNCNMKPTPVFSYYKPGSRCEIEMWRGCPTLNKFDNEYLCSLHCLFRMKYEVVEEPLNLINECEVPLNTEKCTNETATVFTHVNGTCIEATWSGCKTYNKFDDKATCHTTCHVQEIDLEKELEKLAPEPLEKINVALKQIVEEELTTEATIEAVTEAKDEETTTDHVTEPTTDYDYIEVSTTEAVTEAKDEETTTDNVTEPTTDYEYIEVLNA